MNYLKQSTAATIKLGAFVDDTDGKTAETGLTISQADIRLSKNGGDFAQTNNSAGATHDEFGYYNIPLDTTDTNTLGRLRVAISESGALPVWQDFLVVTANVYDTLCSTDKLDVAAVELKSTQGAITWGQQKIVANVALEGALDISNSNSTGYGQSNYGGSYGLVNTGELLAGQKNQGTMKDVDGFDPALALEATLTAIKGVGWTNQTLVKIVTDISNISAGSGATPQQIWEYATRVLTAGTNITIPTAADVADAVWDEAISEHTTATTFGGKNQKVVPSETVGDYRADVSSLATAASLTTVDNKVGTIDGIVDAIKAKTDNLPTSPAEAGEYTAAIAAVQADLDNPDQYKADVSTLATTAHVQEVENKVDLLDVTTVANSGKIDAVDAKVSAIDTDTVMSFMIDGFTFEEIVQIMAAVLAGKLARSGDTLTFRDLADTVDRVVAETDANKQRTDMTYTV